MNDLDKVSVEIIYPEFNQARKLIETSDMAITAEQAGENIPTESEVTSEKASPKDAKSQLKGLSVRQKIYFGFGGVILLVAANMGYTLFKLKQAEQIGKSAIEQRQPAANLFQRLVQDLNAATAALNNYLLTGQQEQREEFGVIEQRITHRLGTAHLLDLVKSGEIETESLTRAKELFAKFLQSADKLYEMRDNKQNNRGLILAQDTLNGPATRFLNLINLLLGSEDIDVKDPKGLEAYTTLQALRYNWTQMMSNLRLYIVSQGDSFIPNFNNFAEQTGVLLDKLSNMDYEIGFGELEEMVKIREEYVFKYPAVIEIFKSGNWRADSYLMKTEVNPTLNELRQIFENSAETLSNEALNSGQDLTEAQQNINSSTIVSLVIVLWVSVLLSLKISGDIVPSIRSLMTAADQIAKGDLNAEVMVTTKDEIGMLGNSFNAMVNDLRAAQLNEFKLIEKLTDLNEDLENRVEERTEDLARSESKIRAILDNIGEGILVLEDDGCIQSVNPAALKIFSLSEKDAIGLNSALLIKFDESDDPDSQNNNLQQSLLTGSNDQQPKEHIGHRSDGSTFPMEYVVTSTKLGDKVIHVCIVRDITLRKETEATLADAQSQLVDAAHKSGMADMATGVLHNIGNILNSVNLAGEEIVRMSTGSKVKGLIKANELLEQNMDNIGDFLVNDERGKKLPGYLLKMGSVLEDEISSIRKESKSLIEKTTMMKEVISTQQAYAHAGFHSEKLSLDELVEDALKIQIASLTKWGVKLHKEFADIPACVGQKSKLLQVITNLIKNAKEAMNNNDDYNKPKELVIETGKLNDDFAFLRITDNGCGINPEQLSKIFNHGFTTKQEGHGFGLHTSANAMTEMRGSLKVDSEGAEKGAVFTITLPLYKKAA